MKIFRVTDRIPVKIGELTFWLSPLKWEHKIAVSNAIQLKSGDTHITTMQAKTTIKYSVKAVDGIQNHDGTPLVLDLDESGALTDDSVEDLLQLEQFPVLVKQALTWLNGPSDTVLDGVSVDFGATQSTKKKI